MNSTVTPLVSIIITTYKRSELLQDAIISAINQTYKRIEIIVVDDNSKGTDDSLFVQQIVKRFTNVKYISTINNSGACVARNLGANYASGEFICFLDDDDLLISNKIQMQIDKYLSLVNVSNSKNIPAMIGGFEQIIDVEGNVIGDRKNEIRGNVFFSNLCTSICQTSVPIIKREVFLKAGGFGIIPSCQEHYMLARVLSINPYYDYVDAYVVQIRHHSGDRISNGSKKISGTMMLFEIFKEEYFPRLTEAQKRVAAKYMRENVINSCLLFNDRKTALLFYANNHKNLYSTKDNLTTLLEILMPRNAFSYFYRIIKKKK